MLIYNLPYLSPLFSRTLTCPHTSSHVVTCSLMTSCVLQCPPVSSSILPCPPLSSFVLPFSTSPWEDTMDKGGQSEDGTDF